MHFCEETPTLLKPNTKSPKEWELENSWGGTPSPGGKEGLMFFQIHLLLLSLVTPTLDMTKLQIHQGWLGEEPWLSWWIGRVRGPISWWCPLSTWSLILLTLGNLGSILRTQQKQKENQALVLKERLTELLSPALTAPALLVRRTDPLGTKKNPPSSFLPLLNSPAEGSLAQRKVQLWNQRDLSLNPSSGAYWSHYLRRVSQFHQDSFQSAQDQRWSCRLFHRRCKMTWHGRCRVPSAAPRT